MTRILRPACLMVILTLVLSLGLIAMPASADTGGPDDYGYEFIDSNESDGPDYDWIEISSTGTDIGLTGDDVFTNVELPFDFDFYGDTYDEAWITSNGLIIFEEDTGYHYQYSNYPIPDTEDPDNMICPFWDDLDPRDGGRIYTRTEGSSPNRQFIIEWHNLDHYSYDSGGEDVTFEAILYEGTNNILFQYQDVDFNYPSYPEFDNGGSATVGIENEDASDGLQYSYNEACLESGLAILFSYAEEAGANFSASPTMGESPLTVQFKDRSSGDIDDWYWSFGDGEHSSSRHPSHTYQNEGVYSVTLEVSGDGGTDRITKRDIILVEAQTVAPSLVVRDLQVSTTYAQPGQELLVTAKVYNEGGSWGSDSMNLLINGYLEQSASVGVAPGTAQTVSFTVYRTTAGEYQVTFGDATANFFIMEQAEQATPASGLLAGGEMGTGGLIAIICIGVIVVAGIVIVFLVGRRT